MKREDLSKSLAKPVVSQPPAFCPNRHCSLHTPSADHDSHWYSRDGYYYTNVRGNVQRYRCHRCGRRFSTQTFSLDYYVKKSLEYQRIEQHLISGAGVRNIARFLSVSHKTILNRQSRLAHQALAIHAQVSAQISLSEDLVSDGFESFVESQYFPHNIHLLLGKRSQYLYGFDYAHLARKGRMSGKQREKAAVVKAAFTNGRTSVATSFSRIASLTLSLVRTRAQGEPTVLYSDRHAQYPPPIRSAITGAAAEGRLLIHRRISSRRARTSSNPLFSVNYLDRQLRKDNANHVRETVQYSRSASGCMERLAIYGLWHNYCKPYRIGKAAERRLHAEVAGVRRRGIEAQLSARFTQRRFLSHVRLSFSQALVWFRMIATPLRPLGGYWPAYCWD